MNLIHNLPDSTFPRVVIVGAGFAGIKLARSLARLPYQVILLDGNNYHQFQPLLYQVATAAIEPASISFPLRRLFHGDAKLHFRMCTIDAVDVNNRLVKTSKGNVDYDYLVLATGATTNYYGNDKIEAHALPMKSVAEALHLRNHILLNYEHALDLPYGSLEQKQLMNAVIAGGGPTGVELAGALAELRKHTFPKDYPKLNFDHMQIILAEGSDRLLLGSSEKSSAKAKEFLENMGVEVRLNTMVTDYDGVEVSLSDGDDVRTRTLIWAAGIKGRVIEGIDKAAYTRDARLKVDNYGEVLQHPRIYAIGDAAFMQTEKYPNGHPQVAQVAIQQGKFLAKHFKRMQSNQDKVPFNYFDKGTMATVGKHLAVADLPGFGLHGWVAWLLWLFVHLFAILGTRNKIVTFFNWAWAYFTADQSLRLLIVPRNSRKEIKSLRS